MSTREPARDCGFIRRLAALGTVIALACAASSASAEVPETMMYVGHVAKDGDAYDGQISGEFALYESESAETAVWTEPFADLNVDDGQFVARLGDDEPLEGVFDGRVLWLEITVEGETLAPRQRMGAMPYARRASTAVEAGNASAIEGNSASELKEQAASKIKSGLSAGDVSFDGSNVTGVSKDSDLRRAVKTLADRVEQLEQDKADKSDVKKNYTESSKISSTYATQSALDGVRSDVSSLKTDKADKSSLSDYYETDKLYTKTEVNDELSKKADASSLQTVQHKTQDISRQPVNGQSSVVFEGVNVHVRNGKGTTKSTNGKGNLVVGYNQPNGNLVDDGSHNVVVGLGHSYTSYGGLAVGEGHEIEGEFGAVCGGKENKVSASHASVSGGRDNRATASSASVVGGRDNAAKAEFAAVSGGAQNVADARSAAISGGRNNKATGEWSSVAGGGGRVPSGGNTAGGEYSSILGGESNTTESRASSVAGGDANTADADYAAVSGGTSNEATTKAATVGGGRNEATSQPDQFCAAGVCRPN